MTNEEIAEKICRSLGIAFEEFKAGVAVSAIKEALSAKDTQIAALQAEVEKLKEWRQEVKPGEVCYYCLEAIQEYSGNPSKWPLYFPHKEEPGKVKAHHVECVCAKLNSLEALSAVVEAARRYRSISSEFLEVNMPLIECEAMDTALKSLDNLERKVR